MGEGGAAVTGGRVGGAVTVAVARGVGVAGAKVAVGGLGVLVGGGEEEWPSAAAG